MNVGPALRDIELPTEPALWPPPPGVWLLLALVLFALGVIALHLFRRARRRRRLQAWRSAMRALRQEGQLSPQARVAEASELLRRAAVKHAPAAAAFDGARWQRWLADLGPLPEGDPGLARLLDGPFRPRMSEDEAALALDRAAERLQRLLERLP